MTAEDLAAFSSEWVEPISIDYRGWRVYELPPNGQGIAALEMLNIMETSPPRRRAVQPRRDAQAHRGHEARLRRCAPLQRRPALLRRSRRAVCSRKNTPASAQRSIDPHARQLRRPRRAIPSQATPRISPSSISDGNIASWIQSIYAEFGSGVTVEGMGFLLQNRGGGFTLDPTHPNVLAGGKRPFHTIIPGFMERGDQHIGFGIMGGANQPLAHAQFVSNIVDYGMNIQAALEAPRFTKRTSTGCDVSIESRVPARTLQQLSERGHQIAIRREYTQEMGRGQAILHDSHTGTNYAASDPRADGAAIPEPPR